jgi:hypothetical protein
VWLDFDTIFVYLVKLLSFLAYALHAASAFFNGLFQSLAEVPTLTVSGLMLFLNLNSWAALCLAAG